ncbi:MAG: XdhC family protein [Deltaproteobacteria bacterium]|nr:XdhC family protein [Deltaproteobacteria bacterium]
MRKIYNSLSEALGKNTPCVLATIVKQSGSSPRGPGTKMLMLENGFFVGTIGGGKLEKKVLDVGKEVFLSLTPVMLDYSMQGEEVDANEMTCGGNAKIFIEPVLPASQDIKDIIDEVRALNKRGGSALIATVLDPGLWKEGHSARMFLRSDNKKIGHLDGISNADEVILANMGEIVSKRVPRMMGIRGDDGSIIDVLIEPVISEPVVYIFGGGHVSKQIAPIANLVGFSVVVADDREEFAMAESFPSAKEVITCPFDNVMERLPVNESSYLIIVTRGHSHDNVVLVQALKTRAKYIGMIGSKKKVKIIHDYLLKDGFTRKDIERVYSPIGEEIGAETPEEIAISIVAQLIRVRAAG